MIDMKLRDYEALRLSSRGPSLDEFNLTEWSSDQNTQQTQRVSHNEILEVTKLTRNKILCQHSKWALATRQMMNSGAVSCTSSTWVAQVALYRFRRCSARLGRALTCRFRITGWRGKCAESSCAGTT